MSQARAEGMHLHLFSYSPSDISDSEYESQIGRLPGRRSAGLRCAREPDPPCRTLTFQLPRRAMLGLQILPGVTLFYGKGLLVPVERHAMAHGDIGEETGGGAANAGLDIADGLLTGPDAFHKIAPVRSVHIR